eukprot:4657848-Amphidinium_carterae.1
MAPFSVPRQMQLLGVQEMPTMKAVSTHPVTHRTGATKKGTDTYIQNQFCSQRGSFNPNPDRSK